MTVPGSLPTTPGADGAALYVIYCKNGLPKKTISIWKGAWLVISSSQCYSWTQTGFSATSTPQAKASLLCGDPQDAFPNNAYLNDVNIVTFDGTNPGNHFGWWEGDVSSLIPSNATSANFRQCGGECCDCVSPILSVISITSNDAQDNFTCVTPVNDKEVKNEMKIYTLNKILYIENYTGIVEIYDVKGNLIIKKLINNSGKFKLNKGLYMIRTEDKRIYKVIL